MKKEKNTDLIKVSTYASQHGKSSTWVYNQIKTGKIKSEIIDGIKFVKA